jgi:hypothetical protein
MLRPDVQEAMRSIQDADTSKFASKVISITKILRSQRERSAQEVAFLACGLPLKGTNHKVVYVNTHERSSRARMLKKECLRNEDDQILEESDFASDIHEKYRCRPDELEGLCLAEFAQWWKTMAKGNKDPLEYDSDNDDEDSNTRAEVLRLKEPLKGTMIQKYQKEAILKTPYISHIDSPEAYYYSLVLLYFPFRIESEILGTYGSAMDCYQAKYAQLRPNHNLSKI